MKKTKFINEAAIIKAMKDALSICVPKNENDIRIVRQNPDYPWQLHIELRHCDYITYSEVNSIQRRLYKTNMYTISLYSRPKDEGFGSFITIVANRDYLREKYYCYEES